MNCKKCNRKLRPAPARSDGESTHVVYLSCICEEQKCPYCGGDRVIAWGPDVDKCNYCELTWDV